MKHLFGFTILLLIFSYSIKAQVDDKYESLLLEDESKTDVFKAVFKPIIGVGYGVFSYLGDVRNKNQFSPIDGYVATTGVISRKLGRNFAIDIFFTIGSVGGEKIAYKKDPLSYNSSTSFSQMKNVLSEKENMNFRTDLTVSGVSLTYNFMHIFLRKRPITPYISVGVENMQFRPKTDLFYTDANGIQQPYYYWSDGTIRDKEEGSPHSVVVQRDNVYETDLKTSTDQNYSYNAIGFPLEFGLNVTVSDRMTLRLGDAIHLTLTDYIDNVKNGSGFLDNDKFNYVYASLRLDMFSPAEEIVAVENFKNIKFTVTDNEDADSDGVDDFNDECPNTAPKVKVDFRGCPFDDDRDGVPNYLDKQPKTPSEALGVRPDGIRILDMQVISMLYEPAAINRKNLNNYYKKNTKKGKEYKGIPAKFKYLDINNDGWISPKELQKAINDFFDFKSRLKADDIYELKEFFFHQK